jgi:hypothetical protein
MATLSQWVRDVRPRVRRASKTEAVVYLLRNAAVIFQIYFAWVLARARVNNETPSALVIYFYLGSIVVMTAAHFIPPRAFRANKRTIEAITRASSYAAALDSLTKALSQQSMRATDFQRVIQNILISIVSELEAMFGDVDGTEFMAVLWQWSPSPDALRVVGSSIPHIPQDRDFPSKPLIATRALTMNQHAYESERKSDTSELEEWKDYHCVLAYPIGHLDARASAALSIKSRRPGHFDGHIQQVYGRLLPAIKLIGLALECRTRYGSETQSLTKEPTHAAERERAVGAGRSLSN